MIITLRLQRLLDVRHDLVWREIVIPVNRTVVRIIDLRRLVAPCRIPEARIPIIPSATNQHDSRIMHRPPLPVVPDRTITAEHDILLALPALRADDPIILFVGYALDLGIG